MKLNEECVRDVMTYLINNLEWDYDFDYQEIKYNKITIRMIADNLKTYNPITVYQTIHILAQIDYIKGKDILDMHDRNPDRAYVDEITYLGHNFYNSIQDDTVWSKTKSIITKAGNHTLKFVEDTAQMVAVASAKQAVTVMMTQK